MTVNRIAHRTALVAFELLVLLAAVAWAQDPTTATSGSAFAVHTSGRLLTNNHVVRNCSEVTVTSQNGEALIGRVEARDARNDLALIAVNGPLTSIASFRRRPIRSGEDVIALGFPLPGLLAMDLNVSKGIVSATAGLLNDTSQLQISAGVQPGNSGGPLLDAAGSVVGIVVSKLDAIAVANAIGDIPQNINFAIKAELAEVFLRSQRIEPRVAPNASGFLSVADAVDMARGYTFLVECDPGRPTAQQRADAERAAAESRLAERRRSAQVQEEQRRVAAIRESEREAATLKEQKDHEAAEQREAARQKVERDAAQFWASHNVASEDCVRPPGVGTLDWNLKSAIEQWSACEAAGTIRPRANSTLPSAAARTMASARVGPDATGSTETHALIYVYRDVLWAGKALEPMVTLDGVELATMDNGRYFSVWVTPGRHTLDSSCQVPTGGEFRQGLTYFLRMETRRRGLRGCGILNGTEPVFAQRILMKLKPLNASNVKNSAVRRQ
jgi:hypothetical protein